MRIAGKKLVRLLLAAAREQAPAKVRGLKVQKQLARTLKPLEQPRSPQSLERVIEEAIRAAEHAKCGTKAARFEVRVAFSRWRTSVLRFVEFGTAKAVDGLGEKMDQTIAARWGGPLGVRDVSAALAADMQEFADRATETAFVAMTPSRAPAKNEGGESSLEHELRIRHAQALNSADAKIRAIVEAKANQSDQEIVRQMLRDISRVLLNVQYETFSASPEKEKPS